jgi:hypothetical protein
LFGDQGRYVVFVLKAVLAGGVQDKFEPCPWIGVTFGPLLLELRQDSERIEGKPERSLVTTDLISGLKNLPSESPRVP